MLSYTPACCRNLRSFVVALCLLFGRALRGLEFRPPSPGDQFDIHQMLNGEFEAWLVAMPWLSSALDGESAGQLGVFYGDLEAWLAAVKFEIPDDALPPFSTGGLHVQLKGLSCDGVQVGATEGDRPRHRSAGGLNSSLHPDGTISMTLQKVSAQCRGSVDYSYSLFSGSADVRVHTVDAALDMAARLSSPDGAEPKIPNSLAFEGCKLHSNLALEVIRGTFWTQVVKLFPNIISLLQDKVNDAMQDLLCSTLLQDAKAELDGALGKFYDYALSRMNIPTPTVPPWNDSLVTWNGVPLVDWLERFGNIVPNPHGDFASMQQRVFPNRTACLLSDEPGDLCYRTAKLCLMGGDNDTGCLVPQSLHSDPPAVLSMNLTSASAAFTDPNGTILKGNLSTLSSNFNDTRVSVSLAANLSFAGTAGGARIEGLNALVELNLIFENVDFTGSVFAALDQTVFKTIPSLQYLQPQCLRDAIRVIKLENVTTHFEIGDSSLSLSQQPQYASPLLLEASRLLDHVIGSLRHYDRSMAAVLRGYLLSEADNAIDAWVSGLATKDCPVPKGQERSSERPWPLINPPLGETFNYCAVGFTVLALVASLIQFWRYRSERASTPLLIDQSQQQERGCSHCWSGALCMSEVVPSHIRGGMPFALIACMFLLAGSNFQYMAYSVVTLEYGQEETTVYEIMPYSLFYSITSLKEDAKLYLLANVLLVFSGILPYAKLVLMLLMWVAPARLVSKRWRGRLLFLLDQIGKFSLVDCFVIQFINGSLYSVIHLSAPDDGQPLSVAVRTKEEMGFFSFVMATVASLILGHILVFYHEHHTEACQDHHAEIERNMRLATPPNLRDVDEAITLRKRRWVAPSLVSLLLLAFLSYAIQGFSIRLYAVGQLISNASYSIVGFAASMQTFSLDANFGTIFSQITFIVFALSTIVLHMLLLLLVWCVKIPPLWWGRITALVHTLSAWSALDVMVLSMIITLIEMETSEFVQLSSDQKALASKLLGREVTDSQGVTLDVALDLGTYILAGVAVVYTWFLARVVMYLLERGTAVHGQRSLGRQPSADGPELGRVIGDSPFAGSVA